MPSSSTLSDPVVVDAGYDDDALPSLAALAGRPPLTRPHVGPDRRGRLEAAAPAQTRGAPPGGVTPADIDAAPFAHGGRLDLHWSSADQDVHGSAHRIAPRLVLTAAHCVRWAGQWNRNFYFLPRFRAGAAAGPVLKVAKIGILQGWLEETGAADPAETAWQYDVAVLTLRSDVDDGSTPVQALGDGVRDIVSMGYPNDFDGGGTMFFCSGARRAGRFEGTVGLRPSSMGFGASGGAWVARGPDGTESVVGLNSFKMPSDPETDYSPVIGAAALGLCAYMRAVL